MQRKIVKATVGVAVLVAAGVTAASAAPAAPGTRATSAAGASSSNNGVGLPVLVENRAGQDVPVSGTVNVGNLPATQQVTGTVNVGNLPANQQVNGTVNVGNLPAVQNVQVVAPATKQVVMQADAELTDNGQPGLATVKLLNATSGGGSLSGRLAISSVTTAQFDGSQAIQVALRAATCDNANGFGQLEDVIVPQNQTVQLTYPSPLQMPFVASPPDAWCLFAQTVQDNGTLHVAVVGTQT